MTTVRIALYFLRTLGDTIDSDRQERLRSTAVRAAITETGYKPTGCCRQAVEWLCANPQSDNAEEVVGRALHLPGFRWESVTAANAWWLER